MLRRSSADSRVFTEDALVCLGMRDHFARIRAFKVFFTGVAEQASPFWLMTVGV